MFLELEPEEEDKAQLEQNIQIALKSGQIGLEDAIDIREVKNLHLANQMIKFRKKKRQEAEQAAAQANIQAQAQANAQAAEQAALAETQKQQVLTEQKIQIEQAKSNFDIKKMVMESQIKRQLMEQEFQYNLQLAKAQGEARKNEEVYREDRKDQRSRQEATQQSQLIEQRTNDTLPKNFESAGNDTMGGFGLEQFMPR